MVINVQMEKLIFIIIMDPLKQFPFFIWELVKVFYMLEIWIVFYMLEIWIIFIFIIRIFKLFPFRSPVASHFVLKLPYWNFNNYAYNIEA